MTIGRGLRDAVIAAPKGIAARLPHIPVPRLRGRFRRRGLLAFLAVMGPGIIAGVAGNDAGGITTYSVMGAETGLSLLWIFPVTIVILAIVQEMVARLGVVTGQGLSDLIRERFGVRWTLFAMLVLLVANVANTVANFGGAAGALDIFGIPKWITVPVVAVGDLGPRAVRELPRRRACVPAGHGRVPRLPDRCRPLDRGLAARVPRDGHAGLASLDTRSLLLLVAVVGTTITPYMQFYLQSAVAEKGIGEEELPLEQADAVAGSVWTNVIAIFIVVAHGRCGGAGGRRGITSAADAAAGPRARRRAGSPRRCSAIGLFGASVLAATIMPLSTAFVICEAFGWESGVGKRFGDAPIFFAIYTLVLALGAIAVLLVPEGDLVGIIVGSQNLQGLLLPIVLVFIVLLVNDRRLMGGHANRRGGNVLAWGAVAVVVALNAALLGVAALGALGIHLG